MGPWPGLPSTSSGRPGSRSAAPGLSPDLRGGVPPGLPVGRRLGHGSEAKGRGPSSAPGCAGPGGTPGPPRAVPAAEPERREWSGRVGVRRTPFRLAPSQVSASLSRPHGPAQPRPGSQSPGRRVSPPGPCSLPPGQRHRAGGHSPRGPRRTRGAPAAPQAQGPTEEAGGHGWDSEE